MSSLPVLLFVLPRPPDFCLPVGQTVGPRRGWFVPSGAWHTDEQPHLTKPEEPDQAEEPQGSSYFAYQQLYPSVIRGYSDPFKPQTMDIFNQDDLQTSYQAPSPSLDCYSSKATYSTLICVPELGGHGNALSIVTNRMIGTGIFVHSHLDSFMAPISRENTNLIK